jgi:hypothetical protein
MGIFCQQWVLHLFRTEIGQDLKLNLVLDTYKRADLPILFAPNSISL